MSGYPLKADLLLHRRELALGANNGLMHSSKFEVEETVLSPPTSAG
jgi:hypothetical protein